MKILIALDGSEFSEAVLKPAADLVSSTGAAVHLLQVVKPAEGTVNWGKIGGVEPHAAGTLNVPGQLGSNGTVSPGATAVESKDRADERARQFALAYLTRIIREHFPDGASKEAVTGEDPAKEIMESAEREEVNLIALATHGRTGQARRRMGSVAGTLLQSHICPLYLVRPDGLP